MPSHDAPRQAGPDTATRRTVLTAAAFGPTPGLHPLPAAHGPEERWLRAVALGGQGRYAAARTEVARLRESGRGGVWLSLGTSTEASFLRQLGGHRAAAILDGRALAETSPVRAGSELSVRAWCDAATGSAADALGRGRLSVCRSLLERCASVLDAAEAELGEQTFVRQRIRIAWVGAESALAEGDFARARTRADRAVELADGFGSVRHSVKSDLVRAASLTGQPDRRPATALAAEVLARAEEHGLIPLQWAAAMLLDGLVAGHDAGRVRDLDAGRVRDLDAGRVRDLDAGRVRDLCATLVAQRGGRFVTPAPH